REGFTTENVEDWLDSTHSNKQQVEATLNHLHILDIQHPGAWSEANEPQLRFLGETLRASWAAKLSIDYPNRSFLVEFIKGSHSDMRGYQVLFYQTTVV
ncbi:MAG: hypothetical protein ABUU24_01845, partial [Variovorax sp.]